MKLNEEIIEVLKASSLSVDDAMPYLISLYYGYKPGYIPNYVIQIVNRLGIVEENKGVLNWAVPLYLEQQTEFDWIKEWMNLFGEIRRDRRGARSTVLSRMKKFFVNNPDIRQDEVINATKMYIESVNDPTFLKKSEKFIYEGSGFKETSLLLEWVEMYRESKIQSVRRTSKSNTMQ